jgi:hypothetical protein
MQISDELWADAQERYDCVEPTGRLRELLWKSFYRDENMYKFVNENPDIIDKRSNGLTQYSSEPVNWTEELRAQRGTDPGVLIKSQYQQMCQYSKEPIEVGDLIVIYSLPGRAAKRRVKPQYYKIPPHLGPPLDRSKPLDANDIIF